MPKTSKTPSRPTVTSSKHQSAKKSHIPSQDMAKTNPALQKTEKKSMKPQNPHPGTISLNWNRAPDLEELNVEVRPSFIHEHISPEGLVKSLQKRSNNTSMDKLFKEEFNGIDPSRRFEVYQHAADWTNRLIHGNSIEVMAALIEEQPRSQAGKVQVIYFDPPYGIDFAGLRRQGANSDTDRGDSSSMAHRAFVDSYVRRDPNGETITGLDPYFDGIYRHAALARQLLTESGSFFIQISNVNVNRIAIILDEVFGEDNRMHMISYSTGSGKTKTLDRSGDHILWYAKDKQKATEAFNKIYESRTPEEFIEEAGADSIGIHPSGRIRLWSALPLDRPDDRTAMESVPTKWELGKKGNLTSQHPGKKLQSRTWPRCENCPKNLDLSKNCDTKACQASEYQEVPSRYRDTLPYIFKVRPNEANPCEDKQWSVNNPKGLDKLADENMLCTSVRNRETGKADGVRGIRELVERPDQNADITAEEGRLSVFSPQKDDPGRLIKDYWLGGRVREKLFQVQTPERVIERCILMASKPGDLVLDPTCGSGTTTLCAERHGRRWITSDAGAWQISITRQRLLNAVFDLYELQGTTYGHEVNKNLDRKHGTSLAPKIRPDHFNDRDPAQGFVYDRRPDITAGTIARSDDEDIPSIALVDRPIVAQGGENRRVASAFTVERLSPYNVLDREQASQPLPNTTTVTRVSERLEGHSLTNDGKNLLSNIREPSDPELCSFEGILDGDSNAACAIWITRPDHIVHEFEINKKAETAHKAGFRHLVIAAFGYHDSVRPGIPRDQGIHVWPIRVSEELTIEETKATKTNAPVLLAEPDATVCPVAGNPNLIEVTVHGFMIWNPAEGQHVRIGKPDDIEIIMVDTDYDGSQFNARLINFPKPSKPPSDPYRTALEKQKDKYRKALDMVINHEDYDTIRSLTSLPFPRPAGAVAIRIITTNGDTMTRVIEAKEIP